MYTIIGTTSRFIILVFLFLFSANGIAEADNLEAQQKALNVNATFADRLCTTIPLTGGANNLELSGNAKAELNALIKQIANLGIEGAAKYQNSEWQGVLQQDLAGQLNQSRNCKLEVFKDLKGKLLSSVETPSQFEIQQPEAKHGILASAKECKSIWSRVTCYFTLTSPGRDGRVSMVRNGSLLFDDNNKQHNASVIFFVDDESDKELQRNLIANRPGEERLVFENIPSSSKDIALIKLYTLISTPGVRLGHSFEFRNIPIIRKEYSEPRQPVNAK